MLFNSYEFMLYFLPVAVIGYFILQKFNQNIAKIFLVGMSLYFYAYFEAKYLLLIGVSLFTNAFIGQQIIQKTNKKTRKILLTAGLIFNISLLGYFKYSDFFLDNINTIFGTDIPLLKLLLPLGISFITFQKIGFLVDCYKRELTKFNFIDFCLFVTFFPQLIAGPIVHHSKVLPQFQDESKRKLNVENIAKGLYIFGIGLTKKVVIADSLAQWADFGFSNVNQLSTTDAWISSLAYTLQLYFDFSGYCDMAIGAALLFNITLPTNFFSPYKSLSIQDFWRRWHMTLGRFFTQYVYIPLGGSRKGQVRTYVNLFTIFLISGIWHGAGWTFVIWGVLHGLAIVIHRLFKNLGGKMPKVFAWILTMGFVHVTWVFFRATSVEDALTMLNRMFNVNYLHLQTALIQFRPETLTGVSTLDNLIYSIANLFPFQVTGSQFNFQTILYLAIGMVIVLFTKNSIEKLESFRPKPIYALALASMFILSLMYLNRVSSFLYFNF
ncbi:MBOAT family O-acyltransferase [Bacillus mycoides]|uniref:MBOAT family O-acyltransferase n=1 Tax=Bacillus mycoides TaxID=1405 RepID=UPI000BF0D360|nr:MBOAT family O-acyltransferase [Bacillus mycoides]PEK94278.1 membrane-bound O-acyltransferase family protein [Bacillus mycoides]QWG86950.1 MBOAT family protein [Bacillus mycoides]